MAVGGRHCHVVLLATAQAVDVTAGTHGAAGVRSSIAQPHGGAVVKGYGAGVPADRENVAGAGQVSTHAL